MSVQVSGQKNSNFDLPSCVFRPIHTRRFGSRSALQLPIELADSEAI